MLIVSDTSPISNLAQIGMLNILEKLFHRVVVPESVYQELLDEESHKTEIVQQTWIIVEKVKNQNQAIELQKQLDKGEAEAIVLAQELSAELLIIDEKKDRKIASEYGLKVVGLLGILILGKRLGYISALKPILDRLRLEAGFWVGIELYQKVLREVNE